MKRILQRSRYIFKAKGRHGTHSPFVYAFVEKVLRGKTRFSIDRNLNKGVQFSRKEINLLARTFQYLKPEVVYVEDCLMDWMLAVKEAINSDVSINTFSSNNANDYKEKSLLFCAASKENCELLAGLFSKHSYTAIIPHHHLNKGSLKNWETLSQQQSIKMTMDCWYFGLLSNHPDFKEKQFFRLR